MIKIAKFQVEDVFVITGHGLVLAGRIVDGVASIRNEVEFYLENELITRPITGIEGIRHKNPEKVNLGLRLKCKNKTEVEKIKNSKAIFTTLNIYTEKMSLTELENWLSSRSIEQQTLFAQLLLSNLTIMNRAIWDDDKTTDKSKVDSLKWSNELAHRIWNVLFDFKGNSNKNGANRIVGNIKFYASQSQELAGHLVTISKRTINSFYPLIEKQD